MVCLSDDAEKFDDMFSSFDTTSACDRHDHAVVQLVDLDS